MIVRTLIAEDEPHARQALRELIGEIDWLELLGEAADGRTAVRMIDELRPELLFLDVRMPELSGLEVLERISHEPAVVFTTAYDRYAVAAFELEAIDYLIKPFGKKRFFETLARVERRLQEAPRSADERERARSAFSTGPLQRLFARQGGRIIPVPVDSISRIQATDDYCTVHAGDATYVLSLRLGDLESRLDRDRFLRVHRSHLVNLDHVREMKPCDDRRLLITLDDGSQVTASRSGSRLLRELVD